MEAGQADAQPAGVEVGDHAVEPSEAAPDDCGVEHCGMLRDLAAKANILPGQAHVYLTSFKKLGFVEQDRASGHYRIGPFAMRLAVARLHSDVMLQRGADTAAELSRDTGREGRRR